MTLSRRRFLKISGAFCVAGTGAAQAQTVERWRGRALGAEVEIALYGPSARLRPALAEARATLELVEQRFSLYDAASELSQLNYHGALTPSDMMVDLLGQCDVVHRATDGLFDPTVQTAWEELAHGTTASRSPGWEAVSLSDSLIRLFPHQKLTLNGIAQGYATDLARTALERHGIRNALINIGEYSAIGGPFTLGLVDPKHGYLGHRTLSNHAIATSSPGAMTLRGGAPHIMRPGKPFQAPQWSTVSVEAQSATLADAFSTALVHGSRALARQVRSLDGVHRVTLVDHTGDLVAL